MITLHHTHLMASDIDATIAFWRNGFDAQIMYDTEFAGARNVFLRIGTGHIHLYDQPPRTIGQGTVHHLGIQTDHLDHLVQRLRALGVPVTDIRHHSTADYAMAQGPDQLLIEIFQPHQHPIPPDLHDYFTCTPDPLLQSGRSGAPLAVTACRLAWCSDGSCARSGSPGTWLVGQRLVTSLCG
jgi:catechol 2,3-dioxygenase-like lactoylglutathione lyase family enzyme